MQHPFIAAVLITTVLGDDNLFQQLQHIISTGNCSVVSNIDHKLHAAVVTASDNQVSSLTSAVNRRREELRCEDSKSKQQRQLPTHVAADDQCVISTQGDGWCDTACNNHYSNWDGGDCCQQTCNLLATFSCGSGGYHCLQYGNYTTQNPNYYRPDINPTDNYNPLPNLDYDQHTNMQNPHDDTTQNHIHNVQYRTVYMQVINPIHDASYSTTHPPHPAHTTSARPSGAPEWFTKNVQFCFAPHYNGDHGQCRSSLPGQRLCARVGEDTPSYIDETDDIEGGCYLKWRITAPNDIPSWFKDVAVCFKGNTDKIAGQCGNGVPIETCARVNSDTMPFYENTERHPGGGCYLSWMIKLPPHAERWASKITLCFKWEPVGEDPQAVTQCGTPGTARLLCASAGLWTPWYWDDTDQRQGGCRMQWILNVH